ncbi:MAG: hypothetical protein ACD_58C00132G0009 [uncultured bacterium]|nr:MAG: hypothetical protein ACD_58C00132G0009 [uncultured bacterium]
MLKNFSKIFLVVILSVFFVGGISSFLPKAYAENSVVNSQLQTILGVDEYLTKVTNDLKNSRENPVIGVNGQINYSVPTETAKGYYRVVVNSKNNLREAYMILAQNSYDKNKWQVSYDKLKKMIDDTSKELVQKLGNDYVVRMVDSDNLEIKYSDYYVDPSTSATEQKEQKKEIAKKIATQQTSSSTEAAKMSAPPTSGTCWNKCVEKNGGLLEGIFGGLDKQFQQMICNVQCIIVGIMIDMLNMLESFLGQVPI